MVPAFVGSRFVKVVARSNIDRSKQTYRFPPPLLAPGLVYVSGNSGGMYLSATRMPKPKL